MKKIKILAVGGTIDKVYFDAKSNYEVGTPNIDRVLSDLPLSIDYSVTSLMKKDSLEMTDEDRALILKTVQDTDESYIIITHGTDTMVNTAKSISSVKDKTIVLTGALEPALFKTSDAMFNIGCAVAAVQSLKSGVYIIMNGQIFDHDNVVKDVENARFITLKDIS